MMRVLPTVCPDSYAARLDALRHHLADRDLAPSTVQAYLSDLVHFQAWLTWVYVVHVRNNMNTRPEHTPVRDSLLLRP